MYLVEPKLPPGGIPDPPSDPTPFQAAVIGVVAGIPRGEVLTYAEVAEEAGHPGSSQAVSNVLRRVPDLPWWRVIPSTGRLYRTHQPVQRDLLRAEGVDIDEGGRVRRMLDASTRPSSAMGRDEGATNHEVRS